MSNRLIKILTFLILFSFPFYSYADETSPEFYLSTDKSFAREEVPYVNLEGPGYSGYTLRVYEIADPEKFLQEKVRERLVKEKNDKPAFADPLQLLKKTFQYFKNDLRQIGRKELNTKTRSSVSKGLKMDYPRVSEENLAHPAILKDHKLVLSFSVPKSKQSWIYKRVPVPLKDTGVFLVEAFTNSHFAYSLVFKSDIHFVTKLAEGETLVYAARKDNGVPKEKAIVKIWDASTAELVANGKTNSAGVFSLLQVAINILKFGMRVRPN